MKIKLGNGDSRFKKLTRSDTTGFYVDMAEEIYLAHLDGVSHISSVSGGTATKNYSEFHTLVRKLSSGEILTIEF